MSSFIQTQPVIYGASLASKYSPSAGENCYYAAGCHGGRTVGEEAFYGAAQNAVDPGRCYASSRDYDGGGYGEQGAGYGGRYGQQPQHQQQQQQPHRMFISDYQPHDVYGLYCADQPSRRSGASLYGGEELVRLAGDSPSAGVVPASSPGSSSGLCSRYSPPSAPPAAVPQRLNNPPQPPVIYPWMKMVHSISGNTHAKRLYFIRILFS